MENKEKKMLTTEDLNRTLGKKELYSIAFGHVIGSGVFSLIGIGIGYTGKSAWIGILLSAVFILLQALPFIVMAGTARFRGGYYSMMGTLWGPKFAGFYIVIFFASNVSLAMYAISFAQYLQGVLPQVPIVPVAVACLTVFFITNLLGIEGAAKLEIVMDIVLALAMTCFIVFGLPKVDYSTLFTVDFAPAGPMGIITCAVLLTWATAGGIAMSRPWITLQTDPLKVYFDMCIIKYFLDIISPNNDMLDKMNRLFDTFPEVDMAALGFPSGWENEPLWQ